MIQHRFAVGPIVALFLTMLVPTVTAFGQDKPDPLDSPRLLGAGKIFIRFTNTRPDGAEAMIRLHVVPNHHQPFTWTGKTVQVGRDGEGSEALLPAGETTPWIDVGRYMNKQGTRSWDTYLSAVLCGVKTQPKADGLHIVADVAQGPGTRVIRRIAVDKPELAGEGGGHDYPWRLGYSVWNGGRPVLPTLGLLVPTQPDIVPRIYTLEEAFNAQLDVIETFPDVGRVPTQFVFKTSDHDQMRKALGYRGYPQGVVEGNHGDEIAIHLDTPIEEQNHRFREHMKAKGFDPLDLMTDEKAAEARDLPDAEQWQRVTIVPPLPDKPFQFYESANFRYGLWYEELAEKTRKIEEKHSGKTVLAGANFSPHMNVWPDVRQWVGPFRAGAMTMTWTEDWWWQLPENSPQVYGFLLDGLRLGGSYHGAPMQYYVMPFKGNSEDNFRRMHGLAYAHGAKIINHFVTKNQAMITWDYVDQIESPRTYQAIHDLIRDTGAVEHRLHDALPHKAQIAIMLSRASDTWDTEDLGGAGHLYSAKYNVNNDERKAIWMALRHAQYPVDMILDEDIAEGRLKDYRVLYIVGSEMLAAAVEPLKQWVRDGGTVYATGGGGLLDEYRQPQQGMLEMYGLRGHDLERKTRHIRPRRDLPQAEPLDTVRLKGEADLYDAMQLPALLYRESLEPGAGSATVGRFKNGDAAVVTHSLGEGQTQYVGALAGNAYLAPAMPPNSQVLPTGFPESIRALITAPARRAGVVPTVTTSDPLVEAQYMTGENGNIVVLINWRKDPIDTLQVRFPGKPDIAAARSLRAAGYFKGHLHEQQRGALDVKHDDGVPYVEVRLEVIDFLLID